jgi:hypothetical protein
MIPHARDDFRRPVSRRPHMAFRPELLERRLLMAGDNQAPSVEAVYVNDPAWAAAFRAYLQDGNDGSAQFGYEVGKGGGPRAILPWINLAQVSMQFSEGVIVQQDDLEIGSAAGVDYAVAGFRYDPATFTATWTLSGPIEADVVTLTLDGSSPTGVTDAAGNRLRGRGPAGTDFVQQLLVLPGDTDRSGEVLVGDADGVRDRFFSSVADNRADQGRPKYSIFYDVDGSGIILARDFSEVLRRVGTRLP